MNGEVKDLGDLRALCLVADTGSITAAARALGEGKGSVSRRLTRLERALGLTLFLRSPRRVQPTEEGAAYRAEVGRALEVLDAAAAEAQQAHGAPRGHLRATAPYDLGVGVLAPLVARFSERYPEVSVEMILTESLLDFDSHQIDVALRAAAALQDSTLVAHRLADLEGGLFAAPAYLRKHGTPRRLEDLGAHRLVAIKATRGAATLLLRGPAERETRLRVTCAVSASDNAFCREVALAAGGIALLPSVIVAREVAEGTLVRVLDDYALADAALYLVHPGGRVVTPKVRAFRDFVVGAWATQSKRRGTRGPARARRG
ncbi:MAG: LysR family transcriptional regulator [Polyangiaceae bacterium]|nr:LysR family transcriptional regulator [Polyangiaceae bacterium]